MSEHDGPEERVERRQFFPKDHSRTRAIETVEQELRDSHEVEEILSVKAGLTMGDDWKVVVTAIIELEGDPE